MSIQITNDEFIRIMKLKKYFMANRPFLPSENGYSNLLLKDDSGKEEFYLNIARKKVIEFKANKTKIHHSYFKEPIVRLEIDAPPHRNPDFSVTGRNHIHIYKEGYDMRWAYDLKTFPKLFSDPNDFNLILFDFCLYCNINSDNIQIVM